MEHNVNEFQNEHTTFNFLRKPNKRNIDYEKWSTARLNNLNQFLVQGGANMAQYSNTDMQTDMFTSIPQEIFKDA